MELGTGPEKLVPVTSRSTIILSDEKFGNDPDNLKLYLTSIAVNFLFWKILEGSHPSRKL